ncbi:MAG: cupin domain-containing protein [Candidatus Aminicenantes bacterium]|nr:cupin domain-containing protein [Candidatus Aminicenantes bacterium]
MVFIDLKDIEEKEIVPGFHARFVHSQNMTFAYWRIEAGALLPSHAHPHEQVAHVSKGEFELTIDGVATILKPGQVAVIPGGVPHCGRAVTACEIIDVFYPIREDYKKK